jgi:hypothetical protein
MQVTIGERVFHLRASLGAWRKFEQASGQKVANIDQTDVTRIPELAYYFAEAGAKANGHTWDLTVDDFLELCTIDDLQDLTQAVAGLLGGGQKKSAAKGKP